MISGCCQGGTRLFLHLSYLQLMAFKKKDPISRPGLITSFHLVFAGPSLGHDTLKNR